MNRHLEPEELMRYLDGELDTTASADIETHLGRCTECRREHVIFQRMKEDLITMPARHGATQGSVWDAVNRRLTRPIGWLLLVVGLALWTAWAAYTFVVSPVDVFEKLTVGAIIIGTVLLLASVLCERYRERRHDPYRKIQQ
ncbi:MAG TPA: zf-HC2 domain-containing protein [Gemmatimonadaceae bacterium]|nr:zf-HC2 domain-containing protein [Gemmatimonadaceae bacterium]